MACPEWLPICYLRYPASSLPDMATKTRIGIRDIKALGPNQDLWDSAVQGFGARRQRSETVSYILLYRTAEGRQRRFTIGGRLPLDA